MEIPRIWSGIENTIFPSEDDKTGVVAQESESPETEPKVTASATPPSPPPRPSTRSLIRFSAEKNKTLATVVENEHNEDKNIPNSGDLQMMRIKTMAKMRNKMMSEMKMNMMSSSSWSSSSPKKKSEGDAVPPQTAMSNYGASANRRARRHRSSRSSSATSSSHHAHPRTRSAAPDLGWIPPITEPSFPAIPRPSPGAWTMTDVWYKD